MNSIFSRLDVCSKTLFTVDMSYPSWIISGSIMIFGMSRMFYHKVSQPAFSVAPDRWYMLHPPFLWPLFENRLGSRLRKRS
jgi:hypothetical protein